MKFADMTMQTYLNELASGAAVPGGGAAAALSGAQGAALTAMVCNLTLGRAKYAAAETLCRETLAAMETARARFLAFADEDAAAFGRVAAAFRLPKGTEAEQALRRDAIAAATVGATEAPLSVMREAHLALECTEPLVGHSNANAASDLGVSALCLNAAVHGAYLNVQINLPGLSDAAFAAACEAEAKRILADAAIIADRICAAVAAR